ncbi:MAG: sulfatase-like hydrolase/transferase [Gemmatimonadales bacterium]|nr:sulfatase-like hydrolase/transferase [Gemmatimonadales bacterium]
MFNSNSLKQFAELYRYLIMVLALHAPVIWGILLLNIRGVKLTGHSAVYFNSVALGYYMLPLLLVVTLLFILLFPFGRALMWLVGIVMVIFTYILLLDSFVYEVCKLHIDLFWLEFLFKDYRGFGLTAPAFLSVLAALVVLILVELGIFTLARRKRAPLPVILLLIALFVVSFGFSQVAHIVAYENNYASITSLTPRFPFYVPFTSHSNAAKLSKWMPMGESDLTSEMPDPEPTNLTFPLSEMRFTGDSVKNPPNILLILLESWRFDAMSKEVTPNIMAFADSSIVFRQHLSSGNSTIGGIFGLFYGIEPTYWAAVKANNILIDNPPLIDVLGDRGYALGIFADSSFKRHKIKDTVFRGIEVVEEFEGRNIPQKDADLASRLRQFMCDQSEANNPFFAFAFFKSSHNGYNYPKEHDIFQPSRNMNLAFVDSKNRESYKNDYLNSVHYSDALVGELLAEVKSLGEMDNTVILITTDHGDSFNDNDANYWGHGSNFTRFQVQVPLIIHYPGQAPREIHERTSHIDISPTLLQETFGCITDIHDYSNGYNLFGDLGEPRPFIVTSYVNHAFIFDDDVFAIYPTFTKKYKFHDVNLDVSAPQPAMLKQAMERINRFYD